MNERFVQYDFRLARPAESQPFSVRRRPVAVSVAAVAAVAASGPGRRQRSRTVRAVRRRVRYGYAHVGRRFPRLPFATGRHRRRVSCSAAATAVQRQAGQRGRVRLGLGRRFADGYVHGSTAAFDSVYGKKNTLLHNMYYYIIIILAIDFTLKK